MALIHSKYTPENNFLIKGILCDNFKGLPLFNYTNIIYTAINFFTGFDKKLLPGIEIMEWYANCEVAIFLPVYIDYN